MSPLELFFKPASVVLIGASHSERKLGGVVLKNLLKFKGEVYPVNPKQKELMGKKSFASITDLPEKFDLAILLRPAAEIPGLMRELAGRTRCVLILSSGFAEIGEISLQEEVKAIAAESGFRVLGPNCIGVYNPYESFDTLFLPYDRLARPDKGNIALVSQSGAILSCLLSGVRESNAGVSKAVGYGNAADISESEIFEYLACDAETDVVLAYVESVRDGRTFIESAKKLFEKKFLIILKAGKGASGQSAAFSHTGRLSGDYEVFRSVMQQFGIPEARDYDDLLDSMKALSRIKSQRGNRVCIITNGGGSGVLAADECLRQGFELPALSAEKKEKLRHVFPDYFGVNNPVDLTAQVADKDYGLVLNELREEYDGFVVIALPNVLGITENFAAVLEHAKRSMNKPLVSHVAPSGISAKLISAIEKAGIPVYPSPERAVRGLRRVLEKAG